MGVCDISIEEYMRIMHDEKETINKHCSGITSFQLFDKVGDDDGYVAETITTVIFTEMGENQCQNQKRI